MKIRRDKLQIYYDILSAIKDESIYIATKPTKIQYRCNISYNKLMNYIEELMLNGFIINKHNKILVTNKGHTFLTNYIRLLGLINDN